ncbi:hypothetical protein SDC9_125997 [bioreactor metagenome]|uniref:Uncharacterized protein n=1 Tax=bioreactor metagenome TaxID=1076179 RepID=A0A645CQI4_9ZZZZ
MQFQPILPARQHQRAGKRQRFGERFELRRGTQAEPRGMLPRGDQQKSIENAKLRPVVEEVESFRIFRIGPKQQQAFIRIRRIIPVHQQHFISLPETIKTKRRKGFNRLLKFRICEIPGNGIVRRIDRLGVEITGEHSIIMLDIPRVVPVVAQIVPVVTDRAVGPTVKQLLPERERLPRLSALRRAFRGFIRPPGSGDAQFFPHEKQPLDLREIVFKRSVSVKDVNVIKFFPPPIEFSPDASGRSVRNRGACRCSRRS